MTTKTAIYGAIGALLLGSLPFQASLAQGANQRQVAPIVDKSRFPIPIKRNIWLARIAKNYPSQAVKQRLQGRVALTVKVNAQGRAIDCTINTSSGHKILDDAACTGMKRYSRFNPALDINGNPVPGVWSEAINYKLSS